MEFIVTTMGSTVRGFSRPGEVTAESLDEFIGFISLNPEGQTVLTPDEVTGEFDPIEAEAIYILNQHIVSVQPVSPYVPQIF